MRPDVPKRCTHCLQLSAVLPQENCQVCQDQAMAESFLCDLLQRSSGSKPFACHAFRPNLTLVGQHGVKKNKTMVVCQDKHTYFTEAVQLIASGRCGSKACSGGGCQASRHHQNSVRRYHMVWGVDQRTPLFSSSSRYISFLHEVFLSCGRLMEGKVLLLWLAPDHLHIYLESPQNEPAQEIIEDLQGLVFDALLQEFNEFEVYAQKKMWANEFFLEEITPDEES